MPRKNKELEREYLKKYRKTVKYQEYHTAYMEKYREDNKEELALASNERCHKIWVAKRNDDLHMRRSLLRRAKKRAAYAGIPFNLTLDDIQIPEKCPIFGIPLVVHEKRYANDSPSLDRVIPKLGYVTGNVIVISQRANILKRDASLEELEMLVCGLRRITQKC
jgi:hypothetical protein